MNDEELLAELLTNPFVLRCAWAKTQSWYQTVEWAPEPEWTAWQADPWAHISDVARRLASGEFEPAPMQQVPYPKQGASIRHYVIPTVEEQFAHVVFAVLLAPFIEARLANVNFGCRWFRGMRRERQQGPGPKWCYGPFTLADRQLYTPYSRDYGLFRRLASWTAESFTGGHFRAASYGETEDGVRREELPDSRLPYVHKPSFTLAHAADQRLCYARLDLTKAYPLTPRQHVASSLLAMVADKLTPDAPANLARWDIAGTFTKTGVGLPRVNNAEAMSILENPWHALILPDGAGASLRVGLAERWMNLLQMASYRVDESGFRLNEVIEVGDLAADRLGNHSFGLPTGLAVSPLLLNVALSGVDYQMLRHLEDTSDEDALTGAYLRFADDMILFGRDSTTLGQIIERLEQALADIEPTEGKLRPTLNWCKARPASVRRWGLLGEQRAQLTIADDDFVDINRPAEFVTDLVTRLSGMHAERFVERRGEKAYQRLDRLHELTRWPIEDLEVRKDTRLAFAANLMARAWVPLPEPREADEELTDAEERQRKQAATYNDAIEEIQRSIKLALVAAPYKLSLWRSAIRTALRADVSAAMADAPSWRARASGIQWLCDLLSLIAVGGAWEQRWPVEDLPEAARVLSSSTTAPTQDDEWREQEENGFRRARVSFLRAHFWRELAKLIRQLEQLHAKHETWRPNRDAWYARIVGPFSLQDVLPCLTDTGRWASALYGDYPIDLPDWECDAIKIALAACLEFDNDPNAVSRHQTLLRLIGSGDAHTYFEQVYPYMQGLGPIQTRSIHAQIRYLARRIERYTQSSALQLLQGAHAELRQAWLRDFPRRLQDPLAFMKTLDFYDHLRTASLAAGSDTRQLAELVTSSPQRARSPGDAAPSAALVKALWGIPQAEVALGDWPVRPADLPAVGLPTPWALQALHDLLVAPVENDDWKVPEAGVADVWAAPVAAQRNWILDDAYRRNPAPMPTLDEASAAFVWRTIGTPAIAPHPTALLPLWLDWDVSLTRSWQTIHAFFFALQGLERFHRLTWSMYPARPDWNERETMRCEVLLPSYAWKLIEASLQDGVQPADAMERLTRTAATNALMRAGGQEHMTAVGLHEDLPITNASDYLDQRSPESAWGQDNAVPPEANRRVSAVFAETLKVRIGQISEQPDWRSVPNNWPSPPDICAAMERQIAASIESTTGNSPNNPARLIVFPELSLHPDSARDIARDAARQGLAMIAGLFWREVAPPVAAASWARDANRPRYFANEAIVSIPHPSGDTRTRPLIFRLRKPRPAAIEYGVQEWLSQPATNLGRWNILPGTEWVRFLHPRWGCFAVAICSDLIDIKPWSRYKGLIQHLILTAWNSDLELYDAMSRSRGYELFANVVVVNHGHEGGSLVWTPYRAHAKSPLQVRGRDQFILADVTLPVSSLISVQQEGGARELQEQMDKAGRFFEPQPPTPPKFKPRPIPYP